MSEDYWQETAQMFEQLIQKPKMTEKLLLKPPFRYLHDIFTATMAATEFANGLYTEDELDPKNINDKDAKINFLAKMIALVEFVIGEKIDVKPTKIVAGLEADKTNLFLQCLFKAATSGIDTTPIVRKILGMEGDEEGDDGQDAEAEARAQAEEEERR